MTENPRLVLTKRFTKAVEYARQLHTEYRKGTDIPYMAHLIGVAALVMGEAGGRVPVTEDMVVAALLHDAVEDHGGAPRMREIEQLFGLNVARLVAALSDTFAEDPEKKEPYGQRKTTYIMRLRREPDDVLLISAADKLYNAKAILDDFKEIGPAVFDRFKRGKDQQLWYFDELLKVFRAHPPNQIVNDLERVVQELHAVTSSKPSNPPGASPAVPSPCALFPGPLSLVSLYFQRSRQTAHLRHIVALAPRFEPLRQPLRRARIGEARCPHLNRRRARQHETRPRPSASRFRPSPARESSRPATLPKPGAARWV